MTTVAEAGVARWHDVLRRMSPEALDEVLAEDVVFHSPIVHTPQRGRPLTKLYLLAAFGVLPGDASPGKGAAPAGGSSGDGAAKRGESGDGTDGTKEGSFRYVRQVVGERDALLEFETRIDDIQVNGIDLIRWNDEGRIVDFKVMIRPLKAIQKVHAQMAAMLDRMKAQDAPAAGDAARDA